MYRYHSDFKRYCEDRKKVYSKFYNLEKFGQIGKIFYLFSHLGSDFLRTDMRLANSMVNARAPQSWHPLAVPFSLPV